MNTIIIAVVSVSAIGCICAILLSFAAKVMKVSVDKNYQIIRDVLPGANCGACGYSGCDDYALALSEKREDAINLCVPGGTGAVEQLTVILDKEIQNIVESAAFVRCGGDCDATSAKMIYDGVRTCKGAKLFFGGTGACSFSCLGYGDCAAVCPQEAIYIKKDIAHVNQRKCIGCAMCVGECPNGLITIIPKAAHVFVACSNPLKGSVVRKICDSGCIGCKKCEAGCPQNAIKVEKSLASVDCSLCNNCGNCVKVCPTGSIVVT